MQNIAPSQVTQDKLKEEYKLWYEKVQKTDGMLQQAKQEYAKLKQYESILFGSQAMVLQFYKQRQQESSGNVASDPSVVQVKQAYDALVDLMKSRNQLLERSTDFINQLDTIDELLDAFKTKSSEENVFEKFKTQMQTQFFDKIDELNN